MTPCSGFRGAGNGSLCRGSFENAQRRAVKRTRKSIAEERAEAEAAHQRAQQALLAVPPGLWIATVLEQGTTLDKDLREKYRPAAGHARVVQWLPRCVTLIPKEVK